MSEWRLVNLLLIKMQKSKRNKGIKKTKKCSFLCLKVWKQSLVNTLLSSFGNVSPRNKRGLKGKKQYHLLTIHLTSFSLAPSWNITSSCFQDKAQT